MEGTDTTTAPPVIASGEKAKARDIIAAIRTLQQIEQEHRPATADERQTLARFGGFGAVALSLFPDPVTGRYKDAGWQALGDELKSLLTPEEYDSRQAHHVQRLLHLAHRHAGHAPGDRAASACPTTPPCSSPAAAPAISWAMPPQGMRFIGVELDGISGRIARALHPDARHPHREFPRHQAARRSSTP